MKILFENFRRYLEDESIEGDLLSITDTDEDEDEEGMEELEEVGMCHDPKTGHFDDCDSGAVYSLSQRGASRAGVDDKHVGRGNVTRKTKDGIKYKSLFGANTSKEKSCGRIRFPKGDDGYKKYSCSKYNKKYADLEEDENEKSHPLVPSSEDSEGNRLDKLGYDKHLRALARGIIRADEAINMPADDLYISLNDLIQLLNDIPRQRDNQMLEGNDVLVQKCRAIGFKTSEEYFKGLLMSVSKLKQAFDGKLGASKNGG